MKVSDRVTVLRGGKTVGTVETANTNTRELASLMVGRSVEFNRVTRSNPADVSQTVLTLDGVSARDDRGREALHDISLTVGRGEIVGVAGVAGNGQRELAEAISGMRPLSGGRIDVAGEQVQSGRARSAIAKGIAHIPEDRLHTGLASSHSVEDNLALKNYRSSSLSKFRVLRRKAIRAQATDLVQNYDVKTPDTVTPVRLLSGGNVQKVLLAREFSSLPKVLIAASPTRGLDVGAIETVRARLVEAAERGVGILLISEDLDEIMSLADRIVVMYEGRLVDEVAAESADRERLGLTMGGSTVSGGAR
jgi:simple sugar transport system ATP-binding protein